MTPEALLTALGAILAALKNVPGVVGTIAADLDALEAAYTQAQANYAASQVKVDPVQLQPIDQIS